MLKFLVVITGLFVALCLGEDCIPTSCGPNEEVRCVYPCPPEPACRNRGIQFDCANVVEPCEQKCVCKKGYFRNFLDECITGQQCDQCSAPNEFFACNNACDNECYNLHEQNRTNCPIVNVMCNERCYCDDGYARDDKGNCVRAENCPPIPKCPGINEIYSDCKRSCPPESCITTVKRGYCPYEPCTRGCICKPGYLRQDPRSPCKPRCECNEIKHTSQCLPQRWY